MGSTQLAADLVRHRNTGTPEHRNTGTPEHRAIRAISPPVTLADRDRPAL
jgi:hypothetical protein